jgi:hypothetical protein
MQHAVKVAKNVIKEGSTISKEIHGDFKQFFSDLKPPKGFIFSADRKDFVFIKDRGEALKKIGEFASQVVEGHPSQGVGNSFEAVVSHATDLKSGAIDLRKIDELEGRFGGRCDVRSGPCACGGWH